MGASRYATARDNLPARVSGPWAQEKLAALAEYFKIVNTVMKVRWPTCFIDLMAGCGKCVLESGEEFDGSPLLAVACDPPFGSIVLVEDDAELAAALKTRVQIKGATATILRGDCNAPTLIKDVRAAAPSTSLAIAFLDNLGLDVHMETIRSLTAGRRMDLVVTFQVNDMTRNVDRACTDVTEGERWDRFFGTPTWRDTVDSFNRKQLMVTDVGSALADFYIRQLAIVGYPHCRQLNRTLKNTKNAPLYRLILFSRHPLGAKLFGAISASTNSQRGLNFGDR